MYDTSPNSLYHILSLTGKTVYWSILAVIIISITILATSDKNSADFVFTDFANETGWSDGVSWILGLLQSALSLIGYDVVMHMTEEMPRPTADAPIAIILSIVVGGVTFVLSFPASTTMLLICFVNSGFAFILVMLFCLADPDTIL